MTNEQRALLLGALAGRTILTDALRAVTVLLKTNGGIEKSRLEVEKLGSPQGGLIMTFGMYPGIPLENAGP